MENKFLSGNFYAVKSRNFSSPEKNKFSVNVLLNPEHSVYKGHFPGIAVAPGVCLTGMIQEILENHLQQHLFLNEASDIKFIKPVLPQIKSDFEINYSLSFPSDEVIEANVNIKSGNDIFLKLKGKFKVLPFQP